MKIAVIGSGMLGLTLAYRLSQQGHSVTIFEQSGRIGGMVEPWEIGPYSWDKFYHVISNADQKLLAFIDELGLSGKLRWKKTRTGFFIDDTLFSFSNILDFLRFSPLSLIDKLRFGFTIFYSSKIKNWKKLESLTAVDWLAKFSGKNVTERVWIPLLKAKLGDSYDKASAAFIWGSINRMYEARRSGLKEEYFGYVEGGYQTILGAIAHKLQHQNVSINLNCKAERIASNTDFAEIVTDKQSHHFEHVVLTCPMPAVLTLCPQLKSSLSAYAPYLNPMGIVCASLLLDKKVPDYYVINIADPTIPFTGVINMSAVIGTQRFDGKSLIYLPRYITPDDELLNKNESDLLPEYIKQLSKILGPIAPENVAAFKLAQLKHVFNIPIVGYSDHTPPMFYSEFPNISIINTSHIFGKTLTVNESITLADNWQSTFA